VSLERKFVKFGSMVIIRWQSKFLKNYFISNNQECLHILKITISHEILTIFYDSTWSADKIWSLKSLTYDVVCIVKMSGCGL